ncbi:MAG: hypothetical protein M1368_01620 [Thaumarchaeota archaeon]|nr:hypothetical protein [Nitrososphaerota archaeon]
MNKPDETMLKHAYLDWNESDQQKYASIKFGRSWEENGCSQLPKTRFLQATTEKDQHRVDEVMTTGLLENSFLQFGRSGGSVNLARLQREFRALRQGNAIELEPKVKSNSCLFA